MTPEQISLVQTSFGHLGGELPDMTARFYEVLFAGDPALRSLFPSDMTEQRIKFADKLTEIVRSISDLEALLEQTRALGARHVGYGARVPHYTSIGAALIEALATTLGDRFDSETREAWALAYNLVAETMLEGASAARPIGG
jgi:hemoglobin-like flavoprotein